MNKVTNKNEIHFRLYRIKIFESLHKAHELLILNENQFKINEIQVLSFIGFNI